MDINGQLVLDALNAMGHQLNVTRQHDRSKHADIIDVAWIARGTTTVQHLTAVTVEDLPDEATLTVVDQALAQLIPEDVREAVARVIVAQTKGFLPVEIWGGRSDGMRIDGLRRNNRGWPPPEIVLPEQSEPLRWTKNYENYPVEAAHTSRYKRDWVSPTSLAWVYRPG
jgi:hypothetical protein